VKKSEAKTVGEKVRRLREKAGLTQEQLAEIADLHYSYVGHIERGTKNPSLKSLTKIADALGVPVAQLMGDSRREIQVDTTDVLRRELLALTQGRSEQELRKIVRLVRVMVED
jgi:transcriptional regulator with XRE-family HTH domain